MTDLQFGFSLAIIGMGTTFLTLWILGLLGGLLNKIFSK